MNIKTPMGLTMDETTYPECDETMRALSCSVPAACSLAGLLSRVDREFDRLSELDCPECVTPDEKVWDEVRAMAEQLQENELK